MAGTDFQHDWEMINVRQGYLVTEGCIQTGARQSFFSQENTPPIDKYTEGEYTWKYLGSAQATKFDLKCKKTKEVVKLDSVVAIMLCTECDPLCSAGKLSTICGKDKTWVYVAMCSDSSHEGNKCARDEEVKALTEYFNGRIKTKSKQIMFVPCSFIRNLDTCAGEIIADVGLTDIY